MSYCHSFSCQQLEHGTAVVLSALAGQQRRWKSLTGNEKEITIHVELGRNQKKSRPTLGLISFSHRPRIVSDTRESDVGTLHQRFSLRQRTKHWPMLTRPDWHDCALLLGQIQHGVSSRDQVTGGSEACVLTSLIDSDGNVTSEIT